MRLSANIILFIITVIAVSSGKLMYWFITIYLVLVEGIFTIVPTTQYVWINQTATFECATNITGYSLSITIPAGISPDRTEVGLPGGGTLATASFMVTPDNNVTSVRCTADDGIGFQLTPQAYAYGQGTVYMV